ncbi:Phytanoyl-CoA dioxygenase (PhyH) [Actinomadura rubteroloni]|uniref:Phytanoyl-CoA dioxygenase (PhyH) n=1 Tax=Actinomadura rubteroloni TaxID=1926885 RepID=A0A2P4UFJ6_9ACTN|nr:phytanoyl-CoA dioxygenase family protein [Actinomadura rubteroloni]POM23830.1 Phytanoyl-CoA dioxygenase (PhyH) [Actinomadura rubteroloni]
MPDDAEVDAFIRDGFVRIEGAFPRDVAAGCRAVVWRDLAVDPDDPGTWPGPAAALPGSAEPPFRAAANTPRLHAAFDALVGPGRWTPRDALGGIVVRFPGGGPARVDGWHVDVAFPGEDSVPGDYLTWRANIRSRDAALLMLFLFSDVGAADAPTRLRAGSHRDTARVLEPAGERGLDARALAGRAEAASRHREIVHVTGAAGDVYLCHPFLVHAGQPHHGTRPRPLGQPKLVPAGPLAPEAPVRRALTG